MIEQDDIQENFMPCMSSCILFQELVLEHIPGIV